MQLRVLGKTIEIGTVKSVAKLRSCFSLNIVTCTINMYQQGHLDQLCGGKAGLLVVGSHSSL